jgi:preprotein translocase subunit SecE
MKGQTIAKRRRVRFSFIGETIAELRKVVWPTRREAIRLSIMVAIVSIVVGLLLAAIDYGFTQLGRILFQ